MSEDTHTEQFINFVSLGKDCSVAGTMMRYGLRSWAGPFDWIITKDFQTVLQIIDCDFADFLKKENLIIQGRKENNLFVDKLYGIKIMHSGDLFERETYHQATDLFQRHIHKFEVETAKRTCFLRYESNYKNIQYITENISYIDSIIKKRNNDNQIVFLFREGIEIPADFPYLHFEVAQTDFGTKDMICPFKAPEKFIKYCVAHYDMKSAVRNLSFQAKYYDNSLSTKGK